MLRWVLRGLAALEAAALLTALLQYGLDPPGASGSGGPQMALFFFVLVPLGVLSVAICLLVFGRNSRIATAMAAAIILAPAAALAYWGIDDWLVARRVAELETGRGYFTGQPARELGAAIVRRDVPTVRRLAAGTDVNAPGRIGTTFLKLALRQQDFDLATVEALLKAGADPNEDGAWPVGIAIYYGSAPLLAALLRSGADPNTLDQLDIPIFFRAVQHPELIPQLLAGGARIEATSFTKQTMLLYAVEERSWGAVEALLANGANRGAVDRDGKGLREWLQQVRQDDEDNGRSVAPELTALQARLSRDR